MSELFTLIGDVVGSRRLSDRAGAQSAIGAALGEVTGVLRPAQALEPTVGDEFQGAFATLADAVRATLLVRLALLPDVDVRCGLGRGTVSVHDAARRPLLQDGPGWWAAREALEVLGRPRRAGSRTWYAGAEAGPVNAYLQVRDSLVDRLGDRGHRLLAAALRGATQSEIAASEGVSRSAVSQMFARGVGAVRDAELGFAGPTAGPTAGPAEEDPP